MLELICFDMDGVLFEDSNFWLELHKAFGTYEHGKTLTEKYLHTDYDKLVEEVVEKLWQGRDATPYYALVQSKPFMKGVKEVFDYVHKQGIITSIVSASSIDVARRVQKEFGVDTIFANGLVIREGKVSGEFFWPVGAGKESKAKIVRSLQEIYGLKKDQCAFVGDSDTDVAAMKEVGLSIGFNPRHKEVYDSASRLIESDDLSSIIPVFKAYQLSSQTS